MAKSELAMTGAASLSGGRHGSIALLLRVSDAIAAILLAADLVVVCGSVLLRFCFNAPVEWSDDVARGLMVGSAFFGAASALARGENVGVSFFRDLAPVRLRALVDAASSLLVGADLGLRRLQRHQARLVDGGPDHRIWLAAGADLLSDGHRRAVHDGVRDRPSLRKAAP
ncbi:hypothetical protein ACVWWP_002874 [Bradyrhizobium sp. LM3.6]